MFETSAETDKIDEAMAKARGEFKPAVKNATNPHFKSKYANAESIWDACKEALAANSIAVNQFLVDSSDNRIHMITRVAHKGQWYKAHASIPCAQNTPQGYGSAATYLTRYSLMAALGIPAENDDDAETAMGRGPTGAPPAIPPKPNVFAVNKTLDNVAQKHGIETPQAKFATPKVSEAQVKRLFAIASSKGFTQEGVKTIIQAEGIESTKDLNREQYERVIAKLEGKS